MVLQNWRYLERHTQLENSSLVASKLVSHLDSGKYLLRGEKLVQVLLSKVVRVIDSDFKDL